MSQQCNACRFLGECEHDGLPDQRCWEVDRRPTNMEPERTFDDRLREAEELLSQEGD